MLLFQQGERPLLSILYSERDLYCPLDKENEDEYTCFGLGGRKVIEHGRSIPRSVFAIINQCTKVKSTIQKSRVSQKSIKTTP